LIITIGYGSFYALVLYKKKERAFKDYIFLFIKKGDYLPNFNPFRMPAIAPY